MNWEDRLKAFLSDWKQRISSWKLYYIEDKQGKKVPFIPNEYQLNLYNNLHNYNVIPKARQIWFSTAIEILWLDYALFNPNTSVWVIAHNLEDAKKIFKSKVKFPYDNLWWFDEDSAQYKVAQEIKRNVWIVKNNESTLEFTNWSSIYVSTSFRSWTLQYLHISEFWKIASKYPEKAKEILSWALEAVWEWWLIFIESTAEWKNDFYVIVKRWERLQLMNKVLNHLEPRLFFVAWWQNPEYQLDDPEIQLTSETINYFKELKKEHWIKVSKNQAKWWQVKKEWLKELMWREYPSYLDEAFEVIVKWAYLKHELYDILKTQRYCFLPYEVWYPVYMASDLWMSDATDCWFFQVIWLEVRILKWWRWNNTDFEKLHQMVLTRLDYPIERIFLPHDWAKRSQNDWISTTKFARKLWYKVTQLTRASLIPSISNLRSMMKRIFINKQDTTQPVMIWWEWTDLTIIDMLSNYREKYDKVHGIWLWVPEHNDASHTWDMMRYLAQAVNKIEKEKNEWFSDVMIWWVDESDII